MKATSAETTGGNDRTAPQTTAGVVARGRGEGGHEMRWLAVPSSRIPLYLVLLTGLLLVPLALNGSPASSQTLTSTIYGSESGELDNGTLTGGSAANGHTRARGAATPPGLGWFFPTAGVPGSPVVGSDGTI